jgi:hypothetical protein
MAGVEPGHASSQWRVVGHVRNHDSSFGSLGLSGRVYQRLGPDAPVVRRWPSHGVTR